MNKIFENLKVTKAVEAVASAGVSSSTLLDMKEFQKIGGIVSALAGTAGVITVTLYESTASTWDGAVATALTTSSVATGSVTTSSGAVITVEANTQDMDKENSKRYVGAHIVTPSATHTVSANLVQENSRYKAV